MTKNSNQGGPACRLACSKTKEKEIQSVLKKYDTSAVRKFVTLQYCDHRNFHMQKISYTSIRELCLLKSFVLRGRCRIHWYTWMASGCYQFSYFQLKVQIIIPKNIGNRKRDCAWGCARGINTTWENLQIKKHNQFGEWNERLLDLCFLICRFSQVVFIPRAQPHAQSPFLFPIVFGINLIHYFDFSTRRRTVQPETRSIFFFFFFLLFRSPVTRHQTVRRMRTVSKSFWQRKVWTQLGETNV